jgi:competence protein ComEC
LGGFAVATWLAALACLHLSARNGFVLGGTALAAASVVAVRGFGPLVKGADAARWVGVAVLLGVVCGGVATAARVAVKNAEPLASIVRAGARVQIDLVVRDDPRALRGTPGMPLTYLSPSI